MSKYIYIPLLREEHYILGLGKTYQFMDRGGLLSNAVTI
jgi:hypothetical protein